MRLLPRIHEAARYSAGGLLCAALHNAVLICGDALGVHYAAGMLISLLLVTPVGYLCHTVATFHGVLAWRRFAEFVAGILGGFCLSFALMAIFCSGFAMPVAVATPLATLILFFWNYFWSRRAILRP